MYSVFLVEDEALIRDGIRTLIAWNEYGFNFVGEASDGELAWPKIQKMKPDIVITDIKMPFMDGLSLSRLIRKEFPQTTIIILSGYDDFSYAKEAISVGVSQYLLKPLSKDQLVDVLCEVKVHKDKEAIQSTYLMQFNSEIQEYLSSSRKGFFDALVSGKLTANELLSRAEKLHMSLVAESYNIVLFLLEENPLHGHLGEMADIQSELNARFPETNESIMFSIGMDLIAFLIMSDADSIAVKSEECINRIMDICLPLPGIESWSIIVSEPVNRLSAVADCYRAARKEMFHRKSGVDNHLYRVGENAAYAEPVSTVDFDPNDMDAAKMDQRIVEKFLINGMTEEITAFVSDYFSSIGNLAVQSMIFRQYVVLNIQFTVNAFLEKLGYSKDAACFSKKEGCQLKDCMQSLEFSERYVKDLLKHAINFRDMAVNNRYSSMLQKAVDYMERNYFDPNISLNAVARVASVSPTHFSAVFSQQMGKTFVEYLTELRMDKAKEMLRCTDSGSSEIAFQVGYSDPHYFSFIFKKVNGCTPREYRFGRKLI